jgi:tripartite-type tricarboxylate transporter receptor subunit TctC
MIRWRLATIIALLGLPLAAPAPAAAQQDYPNKTIRMIIPFGAGGPTDIFTRSLSEELRKTFNQPFVTENRPGAGTIIGSAEAAKAAPDGYTLLMVSATHTTTETLVPGKPFKLMRDFVPMAALLTSELVMLVHPSVKARTLKAFIDLAKANPGKLNYASSGVGSNYHMAGELLKNLTGTDIQHIPYRGSAGARNDIIAGQVHMMFDSISSVLQMINTGMLVPLGTSGRVRSPLLPNVPTLHEAGLTGYEATTWIGVMAPAGTPQPIVDRLNSEINKILSRPDIRAAWEKLDARTLVMTPAEFGAHIRSEIDRWAKIIHANNIKAQ